MVDKRKGSDKISFEVSVMNEKQKVIKLPRWDELPAIDLYIDQVVSLLNEWLDFIPRSEEHVITKTMINNYVKHGLVDAPKKKKYTRTHVAYLIVVCIFKHVYSMSEIHDMIRLQVHTYPIENAYNYYIEDLEYCAMAITNGEKVHHEQDPGDDIMKKMLHAVNDSLVNKFYVQKNVKIQREIDHKKTLARRREAVLNSKKNAE